ncbi:VOC family protein [Chungangia koreensis]|uniref:VOC family protein n=1 Tax=Chungangia koreensis TaxID=752657 RepID=A0ABV8X1T4_9LACT
MNRLNLITLGVQNIVESINFYRALGFDMTIYGDMENPDVAFFKNKGTKISLYPIDELRKDVNAENPPATGQGFPGITLAYNGKSKEEVDEVFKLAELAGAIIAKKPEIVSWGGYSGYFIDPNGYYWEVAYGEMWQFDENDMLIVE